jgi:hypothetical protein
MPLGGVIAGDEEAELAEEMAICFVFGLLNKSIDRVHGVTVSAPFACCFSRERNFRACLTLLPFSLLVRFVFPRMVLAVLTAGNNGLTPTRESPRAGPACSGREGTSHARRRSFAAKIRTKRHIHQSAKNWAFCGDHLACLLAM